MTSFLFAILQVSTWDRAYISQCYHYHHYYSCNKLQLNTEIHDPFFVKTDLKYTILSIFYSLHIDQVFETINNIGPVNIHQVFEAINNVLNRADLLHFGLHDTQTFDHQAFFNFQMTVRPSNHAIFP